MYLKNNVTQAMHVMKKKIIHHVKNSTGTDPIGTNDKNVTLLIETDRKSKLISRNLTTFAYFLIS